MDEWDLPEVWSRDVGIRKGSMTGWALTAFPKLEDSADRGDGGRAFVARGPVGSQPPRNNPAGHDAKGASGTLGKWVQNGLKV